MSLAQKRADEFAVEKAQVAAAGSDLDVGAAPRGASAVRGPWRAKVVAIVECG